MIKNIAFGDNWACFKYRYWRQVGVSKTKDTYLHSTLASAAAPSCLESTGTSMVLGGIHDLSLLNSDNICHVVSEFLISWTEGLPANELSAELLIELLAHLPNTLGSSRLESERTWLAMDWLVRTWLPTWLKQSPLSSRAHEFVALGEIASMAHIAKAHALVKTMTLQEPSLSWSLGADLAWMSARMATRDAMGQTAWRAVWAAQFVANDTMAVVSRSATEEDDYLWNEFCLDLRNLAFNAVWGLALKHQALVRRSHVETDSDVSIRPESWLSFYSAAAEGLLPTVIELQLSAQDLVRRLCAHR